MAASLSKKVKGLGGKVFKVLSVWAAVNAYQEAIAAGESEEYALGEATLEMINVTPMSVREIVTEHRNAGGWEMILEKSIEANTVGGNLFNGFRRGNDTSSRAYWVKQFLSEGCDPEN